MVESKAKGVLKVTKGYERKDGYWVSYDGLGNKKLKHRLVWELHNGEIPEGLQIHHKDNNRSNNNIENLELIEQKKHVSLHHKNKNICDLEILSLQDAGLKLIEISALVGMSLKGNSVHNRLKRWSGYCG